MSDVPYERDVLAQFPKVSDVDVRVSVLHTEWGDFFEIREWIKSLEEYGRGLTLPIEMAKELSEALNGIESG